MKKIKYLLFALAMPLNVYADVVEPRDYNTNPDTNVTIYFLGALVLLLLAKIIVTLIVKNKKKDNDKK